MRHNSILFSSDTSSSPFNELSARLSRVDCVATMEGSVNRTVPSVKGGTFILKNEPEEKIIAKRIKLPMTAVIFAGSICLILFIATLIDIEDLFYCSIALLVIIIWGVVDLVLIVKNNHLPAIYLTLINNTLRVYTGFGDQPDSIAYYEIDCDEIYDIGYKIATDYIYKYNYGKLCIYTKTSKIVLKNVAEPDKCCEKLTELLKLDVVK